MNSEQKHTTETQRTQRLHREAHYRNGDYCPGSAAALKPVLLITSRSLASLTFWSSYLITASPFSELTSTASTPSVALSALDTDEEHFAHFIPSTLMVAVLVKAAAVITPKVTTITQLTTRLIIRFRTSYPPSTFFINSGLIFSSNSSRSEE